MYAAKNGPPWSLDLRPSAWLRGRYAAICHYDYAHFTAQVSGEIHQLQIDLFHYSIFHAMVTRHTYIGFLWKIPEHSLKNLCKQCEGHFGRPEPLIQFKELSQNSLPGVTTTTMMLCVKH